MKKKLLSIMLAVILVFSLSVTAAAVNTTETPLLTAGEKPAMTGDPAEVSALIATIAANRATILTIKANHLTLASQLRTILTDLKSSGATIPEDTLTQLKALKEQLKAVHEQLASTRGQVESLMDTARQYRQARDFENAAATLEQVIAVQQTRITLGTQINSLTQQMIDIVSAI